MKRTLQIGLSSGSQTSPVEVETTSYGPYLVLFRSPVIGERYPWTIYHLPSDTYVAAFAYRVFATACASRMLEAFASEPDALAFTQVNTTEAQRAIGRLRVIRSHWTQQDEERRQQRRRTR